MQTWNPIKHQNFHAAVRSNNSYFKNSKAHKFPFVPNIFSVQTFRVWLLRKLSSSSAVAVKSCFAIASILLDVPPPGAVNLTTFLLVLKHCAARLFVGYVFAPYPVRTGSRNISHSLSLEYSREKGMPLQ